MIDLEYERKNLELLRVKQARHEMKFKILERQADIDRMKKQIEIQDKREQELIAEIAKYKRKEK